MSVVSDTATDTLLDYTVLTSPDPIQVSPEAGDPSKAALIVVVSNPQSDTVRVESITFQFDIGDPSDPDATYLTDVGTDIHTDAAPASQWQFPTSTDGTFRATPTGNNQILDQGLRFTIANIVVNGVVGTFDFTIAERAALGDGPAQSRSRTHKITKGPYAFSVGDFTADPANVPRGKTAILSWQGSENATYTMIWQDRPYGEDVTARRSWTTPPIDADTTFQLRAVAQVEDETVTRDLYLPIMVVDPKVPHIESAGPSATIYQGQTLALAWYAVDADYCTLDPDPQGRHFLPNDSLTVSPQRSTRYELNCYGNDRADSRPIDVTVYGWVPVAPLPSARAALAAATGSDGHIYVIGGMDRHGASGKVEAYDPSAKAWASVAGIQPRFGLAAVAGPDGRVYAIGGRTVGGGKPSQVLGTVQVFDPRNPASGWVSVAPMPTPRYDLAAALGPDGRIYAIGGQGAQSTAPVSTVEAYDPLADRWTQVASLLTPTSSHAAVLGPDGRVYAIGGVRSPGGSASVEWYDPRDPNPIWSSTVAPLRTNRYFLAAVTGQDGRIYALAGSTLPGDTPLGTVEAFDPMRPGDGWASAGTLPTARYWLAAAVGGDGHIYAIGGTVDVSSQLPTVERLELLGALVAAAAPRPDARHTETTP